MSRGAKKYRKKPVVVKARKVTEKSLASVAEWCGGRVAHKPSGPSGVVMKALGGQVTAAIGDYVIQGLKDFYPCDPKTFKETYEEVEG